VPRATPPPVCCASLRKPPPPRWGRKTERGLGRCGVLALGFAFVVGETLDEIDHRLRTFGSLIRMKARVSCIPSLLERNSTAEGVARSLAIGEVAGPCSITSS